MYCFFYNSDTIAISGFETTKLGIDLKLNISKIALFYRLKDIVAKNTGFLADFVAPC